MITNKQVGKFLIQTHPELGVSVFVSYENGLVFCDNFDNDVKAAEVYIKRQGKGKIKVVNGEFYSK
jgi:hypothetical protein